MNNSNVYCVIFGENNKIVIKNENDRGMNEISSIEMSKT